MALLAHPSSAAIRSPSHVLSTDSAEARRGSLARGKESPVLRTKRQQPSACTAMATVTRPSLTGTGDSLQVSSLPSRRSTQQKSTGASAPEHLSGSNLPYQGRLAASLTPRLQPSPSPSSTSRAERQQSPNPPCKPRSPTQSLTGSACTARAVAMPWKRPKRRVIQLGIESEFEIASSRPNREEVMLVDFISKLADKHNAKVHKRHPRMQNYMRRYNYRGGYTKWCLVQDPTISGTMCEPCRPLYAGSCHKLQEYIMTDIDLQGGLSWYRRFSRQSLVVVGDNTLKKRGSTSQIITMFQPLINVQLTSTFLWIPSTPH
jgi:hypothetical protein